MAQPILDVVTEDPQRPHVAQQVEQAAVKEYGGQSPQIHVLARVERRGAIILDAGLGVAPPEGRLDLLDR